MKDWHAIEIQKLYEGFKTDRDVGLSIEDVKERRKRVGRNEFKKGDEETLFTIIVRQFSNPLTIILIVAGLVTVFLKEYSDATVIFIAVLLNLVIGVFQEYSAEEAFNALRKSQAKFATVIRSGKKMTIPVAALVPGDIVELNAGTSVPADIRLLNANNFSVNESALTGEWAEVSKKAELLDKKAKVPEQFNMAFMGTVVTSGFAKGIVIETGANTHIGQIALNLSKSEEDTPFQQSIKRISRFLVIIILVILAVITILGLIRDLELSQILLVAIALAVAAIPEGLPVSVTVVLAFGMQKILKIGGLVRNLLAAETLGSTTVILTDKTGTLTEASMEVEKVVTLDSINGKDTSVSRDNVLRTALLSSDAYIDEGKIEGSGQVAESEAVVGRPVERAIVKAGIRNKLYQKYLSRYYKELDFLTFSSEQRLAASLTTEPNKDNVVNITGAPEKILENSTRILQNGRRLKLTDEKRKLLEEAQEEYASEGKRLVAVAFVPTKSKEILTKSGEVNKKLVTGMTFLGFLVLHDPIRADVPRAIKEARGAGARVIMATGDNIETARAIAREVGIYRDGDRALNGTEVEEMSDEQLIVALKDTSVFARVLPHQKLRIAEILKKQGEVLAMTGDGVNDAPALRAANIGIALGSGTEVAKEASDLVLINNGFQIIVAAIKEGRRILDNLKKVVIYLLSTGFTEVTLVVVALILGAPLPILPVQILWANLVGEGLMNFAFAFEPAERGIMKRNPRDVSSKKVLTSHVKSMILIMAGITSSLILVMYFFFLNQGFEIEKIQTLMFVAISVSAMFYAFSLKDLRTPVWKINIGSNPYLIWALTGSALILSAALFIPAFQKLLNIVPLSAGEIATMVVLGLVNVIAIEFVKHGIFGRKS